MSHAAGETADRLELLALAKLLLEQLALGDVLGHPDREVRLAVRVTHERERKMGHEGTAVLGQQARLAPVRVPIAADQLRVQASAFLGVVRVPDLVGMREQRLVVLVPEQRESRAVRGHDLAADAEEHRRRRRRLEHRPEAFLGLAQQRGGRERAVGQGEWCDHGRKKPRVADRERADREPERGDDELDAEAGGREEPGLADAVPAAEPQHDGKQDVVDADEDDGRSQAGQREAEITVLADRVDGEPGRETAERDVRDVERLDVPRVAVADRERDVQRDHERDDEERRQDERSGDHERRPGVDAVVPADGDAEEGRDRGERKQDRERPPLGLRRRVSCDGNSRRDDGGKGDDGGVGGG